MLRHRKTAQVVRYGTWFRKNSNIGEWQAEALTMLCHRQDAQAGQ